MHTPRDHVRGGLIQVVCANGSAGGVLGERMLLLRAAKAAKKAQREAAKLKDVMERSVGFQTAQDPLTQVRSSRVCNLGT